MSQAERESLAGEAQLAEERKRKKQPQKEASETLRMP
jgi:hypothetical protein